MAPLDKRFFEGDPTISGAALARVEVNNASSSVDTALKKFKWDGKAMGCVVTSLSPDNREVAEAFFVVRGSLDDRDEKIDASRLWQDANPNVVLTIRCPKADIFTFSHSLSSDLVQDTELVHFYHELQEDGPPTPILTKDLSQWGVGRFCIRMVCYISRSTTVNKGIIMKYVLLVFPEERGELLARSDQAKLGSWPGIKLAEGEFPLGPTATPFWQCPILPCILPGTPFQSLAVAPASEKLRRAIASVLYHAVTPDCCKNSAAMAARWEKIRGAKEPTTAKAPPLTWPQPSIEPAREGNWTVTCNM